MAQYTNSFLHLFQWYIRILVFLSLMKSIHFFQAKRKTISTEGKQGTHNTQRKKTQQPAMLPVVWFVRVRYVLLRTCVERYVGITNHVFVRIGTRQVSAGSGTVVSFFTIEPIINTDGNSTEKWRMVAMQLRYFVVLLFFKCFLVKGISEG